MELEQFLKTKKYYEDHPDEKGKIALSPEEQDTRFAEELIARRNEALSGGRKGRVITPGFGEKGERAA